MTSLFPRGEKAGALCWVSSLGSRSLDLCVKLRVLSRGPGDWFFIRSMDFLSLCRLFIVETKLDRESDETFDC